MVLFVTGTLLPRSDLLQLAVPCETNRSPTGQEYVKLDGFESICPDAKTDGVDRIRPAGIRETGSGTSFDGQSLH